MPLPPVDPDYLGQGGTSAAELALRLPRGVSYHGSDAAARESFHIVDTFFQRIKGFYQSGTATGTMPGPATINPLPVAAGPDVGSLYEYALADHVHMGVQKIVSYGSNFAEVVNLAPGSNVSFTVSGPSNAGTITIHSGTGAASSIELIDGTHTTIGFPGGNLRTVNHNSPGAASVTNAAMVIAESGGSGSNRIITLTPTQFQFDNLGHRSGTTAGTATTFPVGSSGTASTGGLVALQRWGYVVQGESGLTGRVTLDTTDWRKVNVLGGWLRTATAASNLDGHLSNDPAQYFSDDSQGPWITQSDETYLSNSTLHPSGGEVELLVEFRKTGAASSDPMNLCLYGQNVGAGGGTWYAEIVIATVGQAKTSASDGTLNLS